MTMCNNSITLYHCDIGLPPRAEACVKSLPLPDVLCGIPHYTDRCAEKGLPATVDAAWVRNAKLVELQVQGNRIYRFLVRGAWSQYRDLCLVIDRAGTIITGWTNSKDDWHRLTAERSQQYARV